MKPSPHMQRFLALIVDEESPEADARNDKTIAAMVMTAPIGDQGVEHFIDHEDICTLFASQIMSMARSPALLVATLRSANAKHWLKQLAASVKRHSIVPDDAPIWADWERLAPWLDLPLADIESLIKRLENE